MTVDQAATVARRRGRQSIAWACRGPMTTVRTAALAGTSPRAVNAAMPPLHDASFQTIVLRAGLKLGVVSPENVVQRFAGLFGEES